VGGREPGTRTEDGRAPTANTNRREGGEPDATPSLEELQHQLEEDGREATDGRFVEPDGPCDHGQPSWLLALGLI
jgi:hypothetical protein